MFHGVFENSGFPRSDHAPEQELFRGLSFSFALSLMACGEGTATTNAPQMPDTLPNRCVYQPAVVAQNSDVNYVPMGTQNVRFGQSSIKGATDEATQIISLKLAVSSRVKQEPTVPAYNGFVNYRIKAGETAIANGQDLPANAASDTTMEWNQLLSTLQIPAGNEMPLESVASANTWDNLSQSSWHTDTRSIIGEARVVGAMLYGLTSKRTYPAVITYPSGIRSVELFKNTFAIAAAQNVPGGYSTQTVAPIARASGFDFVGLPSSDGSSSTIKALQFIWRVTGVDPANDYLPYGIYVTDEFNPCATVKVGEGEIKIRDFQAGQNTFEGARMQQVALPGDALTAGVPLTTKGRTFLIAFGTGSTFDRIPNVPSTLSADLIDCTFTDGINGQTVPRGCDPALFTTPIRGNVVISN